MTKAGKILTIILVSGLSMMGIYAAFGVKQLMSIGYNMIKYQITSLDLLSISIKLTLKICNPSFLDVGINGYNINVFLNNKQVATLISTQPTNILKNNMTLIDIPIDVNFSQAFGAVKGKALVGNFISKNYSQIIISLQGTFSGTVMKIPVTVKIPSTTQWTLQDIVDIMNSPDDPAATPCV